jgi:putative ATP-dependent endonuclease of the OLD family
MLADQLVLQNFRCFGPEPTSIRIDPTLTCLIGANGAGKTAALHSLIRFFGLSADQRRIRPSDFHVGNAEEDRFATARSLSIEILLSFPELSVSEDGADTNGVPDFFRQMASDDDGTLRCRLRLDATWTDDGTADGTIEQKYIAIRKIHGAFEPDDCVELRPTDRARIQAVYIPAVRDAAAQVTALLRGRLWRAIRWSDDFRTALTEHGGKLNELFSKEGSVATISQQLHARWNEIHSAGTYTTPVLKSLDILLEDFIRRVDVLFNPDEQGRDRSVSELSDGQRSLFYLALAAAILDVETAISRGDAEKDFDATVMAIPALTLLTVEEPENNLSPFYLSRIIDQLGTLAERGNAQAVLTSHSPSVLYRTQPEQVRYCRANRAAGSSAVREINLPSDDEEASKFIREAVLSYPELYFAQFAILCEGGSEEVVIPRLAKAGSIKLDQSFVAIVPLGGRHTNHMWRLLHGLDVPHATLLDLDLGRSGGGIGRVKTLVDQLLSTGVPPEQIFREDLPPDSVSASTSHDPATLALWVLHLRSFGVFFSLPLDLDMSMLTAFPELYRKVAPGGRGPSNAGDALQVTLGPDGNPELISVDLPYSWYRYLFLNRSKPATHLRALASAVTDTAVYERAPDELRALIQFVADAIPAYGQIETAEEVAHGQT